MKRLALIIAAVGASPCVDAPGAAADIMSTGQLLQLCMSPKNFEERLLCTGYIFGAIDGIGYKDAASGQCSFKIPPGSDIGPVPERIYTMISDGASRGLMVPDAILSIQVALSAAYPCK